MMSDIQAIVSSFSFVMDLAGVVLTFAFYKVVQRYKDFFFVAQAYRFLYMGLSLFSAVNSIMTTKVFLLSEYCSWALSFFVEKAAESSFINWAFRVCQALFYSCTCMQMLTVSFLFVVMGYGPRGQRRKNKSDYKLMLLMLLISLLVGLPYYFYPIKMTTLGEEFSMPMTTSPWTFVSVLALIPCVIIWIICLVKIHGLRYREVFLVSFGMGVVVLSMGAIEIGKLSKMDWLVDYGYLALPIASSFFNFSVIYGRYTYKEVRKNVIDLLCCKKSAQVAPQMSPKPATGWQPDAPTGVPMTLDLSRLYR